jgi:hypothetical protein
MADLSTLLDAVTDRESFLVFVRALVADRMEQPGAWESSTIEGFFEAAVAWAEDSREQPAGMPSEPSWHAFATFLYCGKIYE